MPTQMASHPAAQTSIPESTGAESVGSPPLREGGTPKGLAEGTSTAEPSRLEIPRAAQERPSCGSDQSPPLAAS